MKKLFLVKTLTYDSFDPCFLYIAETEQEAGNRAYERLEGQVYSIFPTEITEVDGYEVKLIKKEVTNEQ